MQVLIVLANQFYYSAWLTVISLLYLTQKSASQKSSSKKSSSSASASSSSSSSSARSKSKGKDKSADNSALFDENFSNESFDENFSNESVDEDDSNESPHTIVVIPESDRDTSQCINAYTIIPNETVSAEATHTLDPDAIIECDKGFEINNPFVQVMGIWFAVPGTGATLQASSCPALLSVYRGSEGCDNLQCASATYTETGCNVEWESAGVGDVDYILVQNVEFNGGEVVDLPLQLTIDEVSVVDEPASDNEEDVESGENEGTDSSGTDSQATPPPAQLDVNDLEVCQSAMEATLGDSTWGLMVTLSDNIGYCDGPGGAINMDDVDVDVSGAWFTVEGTGGTLRASACPTMVTIFTGECDDLACADLVQTQFGCEMEWESEIGRTDYILVQSMENVGEEENAAASVFLVIDDLGKEDSTQIVDQATDEEGDNADEDQADEGETDAAIDEDHTDENQTNEALAEDQAGDDQADEDQANEDPEEDQTNEALDEDQAGGDQAIEDPDENQAGESASDAESYWAINEESNLSDEPPNDTGADEPPNDTGASDSSQITTEATDQSDETPSDTESYWAIGEESNQADELPNEAADSSQTTPDESEQPDEPPSESESYWEIGEVSSQADGFPNEGDAAGSTETADGESPSNLDSDAAVNMSYQDSCQSAQVIFGGEAVTSASQLVGDVLQCDGGFDLNGFDVPVLDAWIGVAGTGSLLRASACPSRISVYRGTCDSLECTESTLDQSGCSVEWESSPEGQVDYILIQTIGFDDVASDLPVSLSVEDPSTSTEIDNADITAPLETNEEDSANGDPVVANENEDDAEVTEQDTSELPSPNDLMKGAERDCIEALPIEVNEWSVAPLNTPFASAFDCTGELATSDNQSGTIYGSWFTVVGNNAKKYRASACPAQISVFQGECDSLVCVETSVVADSRGCEIEWDHPGSRSQPQHILVQSPALTDDSEDPIVLQLEEVV